MAALIGLALGAGQRRAAAYPQLDSTSFDHKYEANASLPQVEDPGSDWRESGTATPAVSGGVLSWTSTKSQLQYWDSYVARGSSGSDPFDDDVGFTVEFRCKVENTTGMYGALQVACCGSSDDGDYAVLQIADHSITWVDEESPWTVTTIATMPGSGDPIDNTDYHVFRIAFGSDIQRFTVWRDAELVWSGRQGGRDWKYNPRLFFGDGSSTQCGGSAYIDYLRWDADGAYEPPLAGAPVPEPGSAALMLLGAAGLVRKRRRT